MATNDDYSETVTISPTSFDWAKNAALTVSGGKPNEVFNWGIVSLEQARQFFFQSTLDSSGSFTKNISVNDTINTRFSEPGAYDVWVQFLYGASAPRYQKITINITGVRIPGQEQYMTLYGAEFPKFQEGLDTSLTYEQRLALAPKGIPGQKDYDGGPIPEGYHLYAPSPYTKPLLIPNGVSAYEGDPHGPATSNTQVINQNVQVTSVNPAGTAQDFFNTFNQNLTPKPPFDFTAWLEKFKATDTDQGTIYVGTTQLKKEKDPTSQYNTQVELFRESRIGITHALFIEKKQITVFPNNGTVEFNTGYSSYLKDYGKTLTGGYVYVSVETDNPSVTTLRVVYQWSGNYQTFYSWLTVDNNFDDMDNPKSSLPSTGQVPNSNLNYKDFEGTVVGGYNEAWSDFRGSRYTPPSASQTFRGSMWRTRYRGNLVAKASVSTQIGEPLVTLDMIGGNCFKVYYPPGTEEIQLIVQAKGAKAIKILYEAVPTLDPTAITQEPGTPTNPGTGSTPITKSNFMPALYKKATIARDTFAKLAPPAD